MNLESELKQAMARREAPEGFAERVLARTHGASSVPVRGGRTPYRWWGAIAAGVVIAALGWQQYREYRAGVEAKQQLMLAFEITAEKLHAAQNKIHQRNQHP